jgi:hypothetical protein
MQARIDAEIARKGIENMKMDKLGNYILEWISIVIWIHQFIKIFIHIARLEVKYS